MADSATIIAASLNSDQLETSINNLVKTVAEKTKAMADNFTSEVARMEQAVKNLGNIKIDSGGTADGGSTRRTSKQKEEETQVKATTQAYKEQSASFDQMATAQQKAMRLPSEMRLPDVAKSAKESFQAFYKGFNEQARQIEPLIQSWEKLLQARHTGNIEQVAQKIAQVKHEIAELVKEQANLSKTKPQGYLDEIARRNPQIKALREQLISLETEHQKLKASDPFKDNPYLNTLREKLQGVKSAMNDADTTNRRWLQTTQQLTEAQKKSVDEQMKLFYSRTMKIPTDQYDMQITKLERIQALLQSYRRGEVYLTPAQLSGLEKEERTLLNIVGAHREIYQTQQQVASSTQQTAQSAHQYTEEIRRQAQAIRETQQWKEKGYAMVGDRVYHDPERSVAPAKNRLSLEEQILNTQKEEEVAAIRAANAQRQEAAEKAAIEQETRKVLAAEQQITAEQQKRSQPKTFASYDSLRESIAHVLGMQQSQIKLADTETASYNNLSTTLKQLKQAYDRLTSSERNSDQGKVLIASMHEVERAMQRIKAQAARHVSLESIIGINGKGGLSEKTLDDIAYKMQRLSSLRSGLNVETQQTEIRTINAEYDRLKKKMDEVMQKNQQMIGSNNALGRSWNYMKNRLAFYFTVGASTQFIKNLIEVRSQYEMNERALGILINSAERGTQIFNELSQMALVSPYTLIELSNAAKQLTAYDIAAKDVVETTRRLADMASAVGVPMERLTYALGQIKAYGYLNSRDARMFANAGIPLVRELSKYYSELEGKVVSVGDVYTRMKKKAIEYNDVMAVVTKMTDEGGKFFDFQAKMANTLKVQLANLTLAWNNMLNDLGASQQGVLVDSIAALKTLFLHWQDIYSVITKVTYAFGLYKLAQAVSLMWTGKITTAMGMQELVGKKLQARLAGLTAANKSFVSASTMGWMALAAVVVEVLYTWNKNVEEIERLNKTIADGANESAKALEDFINSAEMSYARLSAQTGKLPKSEAEKTWEALREQIEISSASADQIIPKLLEIGDLNQRLTIAFGLAERIKDANSKLSDLENELDISQDSILGGLLGEGLIEDIEDYNEHLAYSAEKAEYFTKKNHGFWENAAMGLKAIYSEVRDSMGSSTDEAEKEITNFARNAAQTIKDELGEEGLKDKIQVNEAIARVVSGVEQMFPKLRGKGKMLFETMFNDVMAQEFNGAVDKQAYYYKLFLERLKKDHGSAFQGVTDDILKETHRWSSGQQDAIKKTAEKVKTDLPLAAQDAIDQILNQLNKTDFKLRIVTEFATTTLDEVQKQFKDRFVSKPWIADQKEREKAETEAQQRYGNLMRKTTEDNVTYEKRISDERTKQLEISQKNAEIIAENQNKHDALSKSILKDAQEQKKTADDWLKAAEEVERSGGYDFSTKKESAAATKAQKAAESELQKALKEELSIIDKIRSDYQSLTKEGMSHADAIKASTAGYEKSAKSINQTLTKFGLQAFDPSAFAGISDPNDLVKLLEDQINRLIRSGKAKPAEIKDLEVKINDVKLDAEKFNLTRITKGLNNELDKLKDEYELAVELDANPELGDMFADMFGINTSTLPQTFGEALDRAQEIINRKLSDLNIASPFDLMQSDVNEFANSSGLKKESEAIKELAKWQNTFRDMFKKNLLDSEKMLDDYVKKYGGYSDKIAEIEADRLEKIKKLNDAYYTEEMRQRPEYIAKMNAINQGASREKSNVEFDAFKNSRYYTMMFENLDYVSTKTIRDMRDRLRELMDSMKDLTPEQLKQVMTQYEKLEQKLVKRSPFKTLTKDLKNYLKTSGDRKAANEAFRNAQKEYDAQEKKVAALKENYKLLLTTSVITKEGLETAEQEIIAQDKILEKLKEQLEIAEKKADKYNLIKKLALEELSQTATVVAGNLKGLAELRDQMNELFGVDASKGETLLGHKIDGLIDGLSKASDGISKVTSSAQSGNVFGVVSGAVDIFTGIGDSIASIFGDGSARTKRLNREINESRETVRQLSMAYDDLERAIDKSLGTGETEARRLAIANKEAQLAELERQKELEQSKRSKDRDDDAIKQYEETIHSLRNEIDDLKEDVVNNLWGEDVKSAAEAFVDAWVQAWRAGETTLDAIQEKMDEMIYNLIKKAMTSKIVETLLSPIYKELERMTKEGSEGGLELTTNELRQLAQQAGITAEKINVALGEFYGNLANLGIISPTEESKELSALQQGIQGITEDTAGALEAYMNGVSQQVYYQSDLLTQIRDAVVGFDLDVQVATMSQILLQLQSSYTVQMSIQGILEGWNNPSGQAVRVELIS